MFPAYRPHCVTTAYICKEWEALRTASTQLSRCGFLAIFVATQMAKSASALEQGRKSKVDDED
jgi:hypothetical protein